MRQALLLHAILLTACSGRPGGGDDDDSAVDDDDDSTEEQPPSYCEELGLSEQAWNDDAGGTLRHEVMADFAVPLMDGSDWTFSEQFTGCDVLVFVPDALPVSQQDQSSIWRSDVPELALASPANTHYFFVSTTTVESAGQERLAAIQTQVDEALGLMDPEDSAWWAERLHVVSVLRGGLGNDVGTLLGGVG